MPLGVKHGRCPVLFSAEVDEIGCFPHYMRPPLFQFCERMELFVPKKGNDASSDSYLEKTMKALLLAQLGNMKQRDQIRLLDRAGFGQSEIAAVVASNPKAVSVRLAEIRREARKTRKH